jgi:hypothetical protein
MFRKPLISLVMMAAVAAGSAHVAAEPQHAGHTAGSADANLVQVVRTVTQPFHDVGNATAAGYGRFLGCVSGPQSGAMGVHYVNGTLVGDGEIDVNRPEALMYEQKNGKLRLLGVEYIVMAADWHAKHTEPPTLGGQVFHYNGSPNRYALPAFYELHVWAWRDNPGGTFADWNERVSCTGDEGI